MKNEQDKFIKSPSFITEVKNRKTGTSTMEYVIIIAVGVLLAGLLYAFFTNNNATQTVLEEKTKQALDGKVDSATPSSGTTPNSSELVTNPDSKTSQDNILKPNLDYSRSNKVFEYMHKEMITNVVSDDVKKIREGQDDWIPGNSYLPFYNLVKEDAPWDHKPKINKMVDIEKMNDYYIPIEGDTEYEYYYDIFSNIHYGYVGMAAGFSEKELIFFSNLQMPSLGKADEKDDVSVQIGIDLYKKHKDDPSKLTEAEIREAIIKNRDKLGKVKITNGK